MPAIDFKPIVIPLRKYRIVVYGFHYGVIFFHFTQIVFTGARFFTATIPFKSESFK